MKILRNLGLPSIVYQLSHAPYPIDCELLTRMEAKFSEEISLLRQQRFRNSKTFAFINLVYPYFCFSEGLGKLKLSQEQFIRTKIEEAQQKKRINGFKRVLGKYRGYLTHKNLSRQQPLEHESGQLFACVNEGIEATIQSYLESIFPERSNFEVDE